MNFATLMSTRSLISEFREKDLVVRKKCRNFLRNELASTQLGFGTYRCHDQVPAHHQAMLVALQSGVNLIDTSTNYTLGGAERLVGNILKEIKDHFSRSHFILISKVGYVQGDNLQEAQQMENRGQGFPEMVKYTSDCWHCIHPDYIQLQLNRSLDRMGIEGVDVYLLHNPEYFFMTEEAQSLSLDQKREEFYRRIFESFCYLENEVLQGRIKYYGISSNTLVKPLDDPTFVNLSRLVEIARKAGEKIFEGKEDHHFQVVQFPMNLIEHQGATLKNQEFEGGSYTLLQLCEFLKLDPLLNRPLNAISDGHLIRLARRKFDTQKDHAKEVERLSLELGNLETTLHSKLSEAFKKRLEKDESFKFFKVGREFPAIVSKIQDADHLNSVVQRYFMPHTHKSVGFLLGNSEGLPEDFKVQEFVDSYLKAFGELEENFASRLNQDEYLNLQTMFEGLEDLLNVEELGFVCANLNFLSSLPGKPIILNGCRSFEYVKSSTEFLIEDPLPESTVKDILKILEVKFPAN